MAGEPQVALLRDLLGAVGQRSCAAGKSRNLVRKLCAGRRLQFARPAALPAAIETDDITDQKLRIVVHRLQPR